MSLDTLETAAADLRNAALVIDHLGHTKYIAIHGDTVQVCAYGALQLATDSKLGRSAEGRWFARSLCHWDHTYYGRLERALEALADSLPRNLCAECSADAYLGVDRPGAAVTHFNDKHCPGGDTMATILRIAAMRAEAIASDARKLLTGSVLVSA